MSKQKQWEMFCNKDKTYSGHDFYSHFGTKRYVELHMLDAPIVKVILTEDKKGEYYGWIDAGKEIPCMIWRSEMAFSVCFEYGYEIEEEKGKGKVVRLTVREKELK